MRGHPLGWYEPSPADAGAPLGDIRQSTLCGPAWPHISRGSSIPAGLLGSPPNHLRLAIRVEDLVITPIELVVRQVGVPLGDRNTLVAGQLLGQLQVPPCAA